MPCRSSVLRQFVPHSAQSLSSLNRRKFVDWRPRLSISPPITGQASAARISEASLHLPLIAHLSQPVALPRGQSQIYLDTNKMQEDRQPHGHSEAYVQARTSPLRSSRPKGRVHDDETVAGSIGTAALGIERLEWVAGAIDEGNLVARDDGVVGIEPRDDECGDDHDQSERDDGAKVEEGSQHPSAMLVDLEALDVVVCEAQADRGDDHEQSDCRLSFDSSTEGPSADHEGTSIGDEDEEDDNVAVYTVEDEQFVPDDGDKLPDHEEASWQDGPEVDGDADSIEASVVPVPLAG